MSGHKGTGDKSKTKPAIVKVTDDPHTSRDLIVEAINRRAYEIFLARGGENGRDLDDWLQAESELLFPIHLEVQELNNTLIVKGDLSGFEPDECEVKVEPGMLTVAGEKKQPEAGGSVPLLHRPKWILRTLKLPDSVSAGKAAAHLRDGVLEVTLPKTRQRPVLITSAA